MGLCAHRFVLICLADTVIAYSYTCFSVSFFPFSSFPANFSWYNLSSTIMGFILLTSCPFCRTNLIKPCDYCVYTQEECRLPTFILSWDSSPQGAAERTARHSRNEPQRYCRANLWTVASLIFVVCFEVALRYFSVSLWVSLVPAVVIVVCVVLIHRRKAPDTLSDVWAGALLFLMLWISGALSLYQS